MKTLYIVLKITERCNLNCSYCYYFNGLDKSFKSKPAAITIDVVEQVADFLIQGIKDYSIDSLGITLHGGEPMLLNKQAFSRVCNILETKLKPHLKKFIILLQTNGTLITKEWIDLFKKYQIKLGISLDGLKDNHDYYRVSHQGKGSYDRIIQSIKLLNLEGYDFGILSVIDPSYSPKNIFKKLIIPYKITGMDFLWPDFTHDTPPPYSAVMYGKYITELFNYWVDHGDSSMQIRFFNSSINLMLGEKGLIYGQGIENSKDAMHVLAIRSDGEVCPTDELMSTNPKFYSATGKTVYDSSMRDILSLPVFNNLTKAISVPPKECNSCCWKINCGGGNITNRFSMKNEFDNPSIYCEGLKMFYSNLLSHLLNNGVSKGIIAKNLQLQT